jgi:alkanesulfonate monooxygenase SsuD/methylene tetrahydromethanopterin reductase-like flavin-dependent oxidoreductase (luciferase family)
LQPAIDDIDQFWTPMERAGVEQALAVSFVGTSEQIAPRLKAFIKTTGANELMINGHIYDHTARLRSFELTARICSGLTKG